MDHFARIQSILWPSLFVFWLKFSHTIATATSVAQKSSDTIADHAPEVPVRLPRFAHPGKA
jgi:hypothetical protein